MGRKGIQTHSKCLGIKGDFVNDASIEKLSSERINLKRLEVNSSDKLKCQIKKKKVLLQQWNISLSIFTKPCTQAMLKLKHSKHTVQCSCSVLFSYDLWIDQPCDSHQTYLQLGLAVFGMEIKGKKIPPFLE